MKVDKQRLHEILHHSLMPFLILFRHFRTFVMDGFENIEEKLEDAVLLTAPHLTGKTVMVTGAGGLIGSEISRQLIQFQPARILLLGHGPQSLYSVEGQLQKLMEKHTEIIPIVINTQDKKRLFETVQLYKPDIIYHTAGHQQIDFTEEGAVDALYANVFGTNNIAGAANRSRIHTVVLVSSEQAAKPRNLTEAAKRLAEMIVESISLTSQTQFTIIRLPENMAALHSSQKLYRSFEERAAVAQVAQNILQAGRVKTAPDSGSLFRQKDNVSMSDLQQQAGLSQIELARILKQLKTASEEKARELVISIIKQ